MKKFLSKIMFAAVAVLSVAGFTSCNNTDDDPYVPKPTSIPTKIEIHTETTTNPVDLTPAYGAVLSENILDMYDVTVVLHSGDKTKEVALTKANGETMVTRSTAGNINYYQYLFTEIDGQKGIGKAEAKVTPKANIKTTIAGMTANEKIAFLQGGRLFNAQLGADGKIPGNIMHHAAPTTDFSYPEQLLKDNGNGSFGYDSQAEAIQASLSR